MGSVARMHELNADPRTGLHHRTLSVDWPHRDLNEQHDSEPEHYLTLRLDRRNSTETPYDNGYEPESVIYLTVPAAERLVELLCEGIDQVRFDWHADMTDTELEAACPQLISMAHNSMVTAADVSEL